MSTEANNERVPLASVKLSRAYVILAVIGTGVAIILAALLVDGTKAVLGGMSLQQALFLLSLLVCSGGVLGGIQKENARSFVALALRHPTFRIVLAFFCALGCLALAALPVGGFWLWLEEEKSGKLYQWLCLVVGAFFVLGLAWCWLLVALGSPKAIEKIKTMVKIE